MPPDEIGTAAYSRLQSISTLRAQSALSSRLTSKALCYNRMRVYVKCVRIIRLFVRQQIQLTTNSSNPTLKMQRPLCLLFGLLVLVAVGAQIRDHRPTNVLCPSKCLCIRKTVRCMLIQLDKIPRVDPHTAIL